MQNFTDVSENTSLLASLTQLTDNDKTVMSCHSGTFEPSTNIQTGMLWQDTTNVPYKLKTLQSSGPNTWRTIPTYSGTPATGDSLAFDPTLGWRTTTPASGTFEGLADTTFANVQQGDVTVYDNTDGWVNSPASVANIASKVYEGPAGGPSDADYYTKVATFTASSINSGIQVLLSYTMGNGGTASSGIISVSARAEGTSDISNLQVSNLGCASYIVGPPNFYMKVDTSSSIAELWMQKHTTYQQFYMYEISKLQEPGMAVEYHTNEVWLASFTPGTGVNDSAIDLQYSDYTVWHSGNDGTLVKTTAPHTLNNTYHTTGVNSASLAFSNFNDTVDYPYLSLTAPMNISTGKASLVSIKAYNDAGIGKEIVLDARGSGDAIISVPGSIRASGAITANYSDPRLKTGWKNFSNISQKMKKWTAGRHYWTLDSGFDTTESQVGLDADQVRKDVPEIVKFAPGDRDIRGQSISGKNYLTIQYDKLSVINTAAINEHTDEIDRLIHRVNDLEEMVRGLTTSR